MSRLVTFLVLFGLLTASRLFAQDQLVETWATRHGAELRAQESQRREAGKGAAQERLDVTAASWWAAADGDENWDSTFTGYPGTDDYVGAIGTLDGDVYVGGYFSTVGGGTTPVRGFARWDGERWLDVAGGLYDRFDFQGRIIYQNGWIGDVASSNGRLYVGGDFVYAGQAVGNDIGVWDGLQWSPLGRGIGTSVRVPQEQNSYTNSWVSAVAASGGDVYVGGAMDSAGTSAVDNIALWRDSTWMPLGDGFEHWIEDIAVDSHRVVAVGYRSRADYARGKFVAEWNGTEWVSLADNVLWDGYVGRVDAVAIYDGDVYAGGLFDRIEGVDVNSIARWDGERWHPVGQGVDGNIWRLQPHADGIIATGLFRNAGGKPAARIAFWDSERWSTLGSGVSDRADSFGGRIDAVTVDGERVYAGGRFIFAGGAIAKNVAQWDGTSWSAFGETVGNGLSATANAVAIGPDGVYVAGDFALAGNVVVNGIARWDGSDWHPLGEGIEGWIHTILVHESDVYVGGYIPKAGSVKTSGIARWDGTRWHSVGAVRDSDPVYGYEIRALAFFRDTLFAGGAFWDRRFRREYPFMKWDGSAWQQVGGDFVHFAWGSYWSPGVHALADADSVLYVGGNFSMIGDTPFRNIARWDGRAWSDVGGGVSYHECCGESVRGIAVGHEGVYVAGDFTRAGGRTAGNVAFWNGVEWSTMRGGADYITDNLALDGTNLYLIGTFDRPGAGIAHWDGAAWHKLGSGLSGYANAIAAKNGDVYVVGSFSRAGGKPSFKIAHWTGPRTNTAVEELPAASGLALEAVYPNPFHETATVSFRLESAGPVVLALYDILGRKAATPASGFHAAGSHEVTITAGSMAPGMYLCRLETAAGSRVVKVVKAG